MKKKTKTSATTKNAVRPMKAKKTKRPAKKTKQTSSVEVRQLADLKPHPLAELLFGKMPQELCRHISKVCDNLKQEGIHRNETGDEDEDPGIEILSDGTVVQGFDFVVMCKERGHREVDVLVRYDLEQKDEQAIISRITDDMTFKRHQSEIEEFRCGLAYHGYVDVLKQAMEGVRVAASVQKTIAKKLYMDEDDVEALLNLLSAPPDILNLMCLEMLRTDIVIALRDAGISWDKLRELVNCDQENVLRANTSYDATRQWLTLRGYLALREGNATEYFKDQLDAVITCLQFHKQHMDKGWAINEADESAAVVLLDELAKAQSAALRIAIMREDSKRI